MTFLHHRKGFPSPRGFTVLAITLYKQTISYSAHCTGQLYPGKYMYAFQQGLRNSLQAVHNTYDCVSSTGHASCKSALTRFEDKKMNLRGDEKHLEKGHSEKNR